jgi:short-subunit dehydrogenase
LKKYALIVGNSDGIGLILTKKLLKDGWHVVGISRSPSGLNGSGYRHIIQEVQKPDFIGAVKELLENHPPFDLCVYCAGIGELLNLSEMHMEVEVVEVNLMGMVKLASLMIPKMVERKEGHFIGLSSVADAMLSEEAPSYHASKAGFTNYLESLALSTRVQGVYVSNIRFGFVDTKMAKGDVRPFMMTVDQAVAHIFKCMDSKQVRMTRPRIVSPLIAFRNRMLKLENFKNKI